MPKKLTANQLRLLRDMCENDWLFVTSSSMSATSVSLKDRNGKVIASDFRNREPWFNYLRSNAMPGGPILSELYYRVDKNKLPFNMSWFEVFYSVRKAGREYWENEGKERLAQIEAKEAAERKNVERLIIVCGRGVLASKLEYREYGWLARVVRETEKRIYVEVVKSASDINPKARLSDYETFHGRPGNLYVADTMITVDPATEEQFDRLVRAETDVIADRMELHGQMEAEIAKIRERYKQRAEQQSAMHEEMIQKAKNR